MSDTSNLKAAREVHHKLEFYLVALAFTTAAFATQTGKPSGCILGDVSEITSWLLLVLSGLVGLWRLEHIPVAYRTYEYVKKRKISVAEFEPQLEKIESGNLRKYFWQKLFLVAGFVALLLSRLISQTKGLYW